MGEVDPAPAKKLRSLPVGWISIGVLFLLCALQGTIWWTLVFGYHLATGWFRHLINVVPALNFEFSTILLSLVAAAVAIAMLQRFLRSTFNPSWSLRRTLLSSGIFLTLTAAAIAMTGIIHELAWLSRAPLITDRGKNAKRTEAINNGKQIYFAMLEMAKEGIHPNSLEEIVEFFDYRGDMFTYLPSYASYAREPFLLLHPGEDITGMAPETPIIAALGVDGSRCIVVLADGSVEVPNYKDIETLLLAK